MRKNIIDNSSPYLYSNQTAVGCRIFIAPEVDMMMGMSMMNSQVKKQESTAVQAKKEEQNQEPPNDQTRTEKKTESSLIYNMNNIQYMTNMLFNDVEEKNKIKK